MIHTIAPQPRAARGRSPFQRKHFFHRLLVVSSVALGCLALYATDATDPGTSRPLDLPSGGPGADDDEESIFDTIQFFGGAYEGDAFVWCLDKSCSMAWQGDFSQLQIEVIASLESLTEASQFSLVAFSSGHIVWSPTLREGSFANRQAAIEWVRALEPAGASCIGPAVVKTIAISNLAIVKSKHIIILSDGAHSCGEEADSSDAAISAITRANWQRSPIHTISLAGDAKGNLFLEQVARQNSGSFRRPPR